jgi:hypothetical protein
VSAARPLNLIWIVLAGAVAVTLCAVDNRSLWIDEAGSAVLASEPSFVRFVGSMFQEGGSTAQMPLHGIYAWLWIRMFGISEVCLRLSNLPWFLMGTAALCVYWPRRTAPFLILVTFFSPFLWYYLNEFRPYAMGWAGASMIVAPLYAQLDSCGRQEARRVPVFPWTLGAGLVVLAASSMLGALWCVGAILAWFWTLPRKGYRDTSRSSWGAITATACILCLLAVYYLLTLRMGSRGAAVGRTGIKEVAFAVYELIGMLGLGPGRLELRATSGAALGQARYFVPVGAAAVGLALVVVRSALHSRPWRIPRHAVFWILLASPATVLIGVGMVMDFRVLGRHFTPGVLLFSALLAYGLDLMWRSRHLLQRAGVCVLLGVLAFSCAQVRLAPRHAKDDYRKAAALAKDASRSGLTVWWAADVSAARYYRIEFPDAPDVAVPGRILPVRNTVPESPDDQPPPSLMILSKEDLFDATGSLRDYAIMQGFVCVDSFPAFTVWARSTGPHHGSF